MDLSSMSGLQMPMDSDEDYEGSDFEFDMDDEDIEDVSGDEGGHGGGRDADMSMDETAQQAAPQANVLVDVPLETSITGYGNAGEKQFVVYIVCLHQKTTTWTIFRRYRQFKALNDKLLRQGVQMASQLPKKQMFGSNTQDFIEKRWKGLSVWLTQLAGNLSKMAHHSAAADVLKFFSAEANTPPPGFEVVRGEAVEQLTAAGATPSPQKKSRRKRCRVTVQDFVMLKMIGKGSFGEVMLVRKKDNKELYAMKILDKKNIKRRNQVEHTITERRVLGRTKHPFIVTLHFAFQSAKKLYFVLDYCQGGELFFHLGRCGRLRESLACFYSAEITLALSHLHSVGIMYRDLKPENILLDKDGHVKLADFGLSKEGILSGTSGTGSFCGTAEYLAPEILNRAGHGTGVDWWALGMVLYEMLTGMPPWYTKERDVLFERVCRAPLEFPTHVSGPARKIIQGLLTRDPQRRLGIHGKGAQEIMAQDFFSHINWKSLYDRRIPPPFRPRRDIGSVDASNFDKVFTKMRVTQQPNGPMSLAQSAGVFPDFSYQRQHYRSRFRSQGGTAIGTPATPPLPPGIAPVVIVTPAEAQAKSME